MALKKNLGKPNRGVVKISIAKLSILGVLFAVVVAVGALALWPGDRATSAEASPTPEIESTPTTEPTATATLPPQTPEPEESTAPVEIPEVGEPEETPKATTTPKANTTPKATSTPKATATPAPTTTPTASPTATPGSGTLMVTVSKSVIAIGEKSQITVYQMPEKIAINSNDIHVSSSNDKIASIDNSGVITGILGGTVTITAKNTKTGAVDTVSLTVDGPPNSQSHTLSITVPGMSGGTFGGLQATVSLKLMPDGDTVPNSECTFTSSNPACFTVSSSGTIQALAPGTARLTVTYTKVNITGTVDITIP